MPFCAFCGKEVSELAVTCPQCGHPQGRTAAPLAGPARRQSGNAIASLVLGIAAFVICPVIPAVIAIILGNSAKREIAANPDLEGQGMAQAGIILGWINVGLIVFVGIIFAIAAAVHASGVR